MALDTRDRRASAVHVGLPWRGLLPLPDAASEDQGDRQHVGGYYRGVLAALPGFGAIPLLEFGPLAVLVAAGSTVVATVAAGGAGCVVMPAGGDRLTMTLAGGGGIVVIAASGARAAEEV